MLLIVLEANALFHMFDREANAGVKTHQQRQQEDGKQH